MSERYLFLVDRAKDMIISGGENVYCTEVEEVLYRTRPCWRPRSSASPTRSGARRCTPSWFPVRARGGASRLIAYCRERIAGYKVPKQIDLRDEPLPKSGPGKVLKRELRAPFWAGQATQVH